MNKLEGFEFSSFAEFFRDFLSAPELVVDYAPSIISISTLFTPSYKNMLDIAQCCRGIFPNAVIVAGGGVPEEDVKITKYSETVDVLTLSTLEREKSHC